MPKRSTREAQKSECDGEKGDNLDGGSSSAMEDGRKRRIVEANEPDTEARKNVTNNQGLSSQNNDPDEAISGDSTEVDASPVDSIDATPTTQTDNEDDDRRENRIEMNYSDEELEKYSRYKMNHSKRGIALIFNHENFKNEKLKKRLGAEVDGTVLRNTLEGLGFDVQLHKDKKVEEVWEIISQVASVDHTDHDCLLVAFMTHGEDNGILFAYDHRFKIEEVFERFKSDRVPSLGGKPKIFLFQACRGAMLEESVPTLSPIPMDTTDAFSGRCFILPSTADFLFVYSSMKGHYSWRNEGKGSWLIQDLCKELNKDARRKDILTIVTNTLRRVAYTRFSKKPEIPYLDKRQQMPVFSSTLTRFLYFYDTSS